MAINKMTCSKCGRTLKETEFFKQKTGDRFSLCKDCLTQHIDNRDPETFMWILQKFDVPYIKKVWIRKTNEIYQKDPGRFGPKSVIGTYLRMMNMTQYKDYSYADTERLNKPPKKDTKDEVEEREAELKRQYEAGEISKAEYETLSTTSEKPEAATIEEEFFTGELPSEMPAEADVIEQSPAYLPKIDEGYWVNQLSEDDIQYLMLKWGTVYTPQEWITMEKMYQDYAGEYDINVDREAVLKKMCKTSLRMDLALDTGDLTGYKSLAQVFDQLRKSGKFTEAQNKDEREKPLESIGELVALCETEGGGLIPKLPQYDPDDYPRDKIDLTLKDLKSYTYNLVTNELGLGNLIESYVEKLERAENTKSTNLEDGLFTSREEQEQDILTDEEAAEFFDFKQTTAEEERGEL